MLRERRLERIRGCRRRVLRLLRFPGCSLALRERLILKEGRNSKGRGLEISKYLMSVNNRYLILPS